MSNSGTNRIVQQVLKEEQSKVYVPKTLRYKKSDPQSAVKLVWTPGKANEAFAVKLNTTWFNEGDKMAPNLTKLQILTLPKFGNHRWYHRVMNKLTLGYLCPMYFEYRVKKV